MSPADALIILLALAVVMVAERQGWTEVGP